MTGRSPFHGNHALDIARKVSDLAPAPVHEVNPAIPLFLSTIVGRLLEKDPDQRYQSAQEVHDLFVGHLVRVQPAAARELAEGVFSPAAGIAAAPRPVPGGKRTSHPRWRRRLAWAAGAAGLLLLAVVLAWRSPTPRPDPEGDPLVTVGVEGQ